MKKDKWVWMPHPGHYICSRDCKFILNTYVGGYIVSTVGEYWPDEAIRRIHAEVHDLRWYSENRLLKGDDFDHAYMKKFGYEDLHIGGWKYETMVFKAVKAKDAESGYQCCPWRQGSGSSVDEEVYKTATEAYKGHLKLCDKWSSERAR